MRGNHAIRFSGRPSTGARIAAHGTDLCAGADHQSVVLVPPRHDDVRLQRRLLDLRAVIRRFEDTVGLFESLFHTAHFPIDDRRQVARAVLDLPAFRLVVQNGRARLHALARIEDCGQWLVLDLDQFQRLERDLFALRRHGGHAIAHKAHFVVQAVVVVRAWFGIALPGGGVRNARQVLVRQHSMHTGQRSRPAGIDALDQRVGVRAEQQLADQHATEIHVIGEGRLALHQLARIHLLRRFAHLLERVDFGRHHHHGRDARPDALRTGSGRSVCRLRRRDQVVAVLSWWREQARRRRNAAPAIDFRDRLAA